MRDWEHRCCERCVDFDGRDFVDLGCCHMAVCCCLIAVVCKESTRAEDPV